MTTKTADPRLDACAAVAAVLGIRSRLFKNVTLSAADVERIEAVGQGLIERADPVKDWRAFDAFYEACDVISHIPSITDALHDRIYDVSDRVYLRTLPEMTAPERAKVKAIVDRIAALAGGALPEGLVRSATEQVRHVIAVYRIWAA